MKKCLVVLSLLLAMVIVNDAIALEFRYPVGGEDGKGWKSNRGGLQWVNEYNYAGECGWTYHPGVDFNQDGTTGDGDLGQPVYAVANGIVQESYYEGGSGWGNLVLIKHESIALSLYGHLDKRYVKAGDTVIKGQLIGTVGKGIGFMAHLHFEIRKNSMAGYSAKFFPCGDSGYKLTFISNNYYDPEAFINSNKSSSQNPPIKFTDSNIVYYNSNGQLWPIRNDIIYTLLGYRKGDCMSALEADWNKLKVLPASDKSKYVIRPETIGTAGTSPMWRISYRETPDNCTVGPVDTTKLYLFSLENGQPKFRHIPDWNVYLNLGFDPSGKDIVDVPMELFNYFGKGAEINSGNVVAVVATNSSFLFDNTHLSINETEILPPVNSTSLNAPINFSGDAIAGNQIQLVWSASNGSMDVDYKIYQKKEGDSGDPVYWGHTNQTNCKDDEVLSNQIYCYQVTASYGGEESAKTNIICVSSTYVNVTTPSEGGDVGGDWSIASIGDGLVNGTAYYSENSHTYTIKGTGIGIGDDNVKCTYMYQAHSDCAGVKTHLISHTLADPKAMAGIMFMETPNINSNYVLVAATQNNGIVLQYKEYGIVKKIGSDYYDYPVYLRLSRNGNKFMAEYSFTGISGEWISIGTVSLNFSTNYQVGLFATPGTDSSVSTAIFGKLDVSSNPKTTSGLRLK